MKGSKIHVAVTPRSLPIVTGLGLGNEHESRKFIALLNDIQIRNNNGRPKSRPERIWADTKYHTFLVLTYLYNRRIRAQIRERSNTKPKQGRPNIFLYQDYRKVRSSVERFFGWLKSFRRIQTRYERLASTYLGFIQLGCMIILMRLFRWFQCLCYGWINRQLNFMAFNTGCITILFSLNLGHDFMLISGIVIWPSIWLDSTANYVYISNMYKFDLGIGR